MALVSSISNFFICKNRFWNKSSLRNIRQKLGTFGRHIRYIPYFTVSKSVFGNEKVGNRRNYFVSSRLFPGVILCLRPFWQEYLEAKPPPSKCLELKACLPAGFSDLPTPLEWVPRFNPVCEKWNSSTMHWTTAIANPEFHDHQCKCNYVFMYDYYNR